MDVQETLYAARALLPGWIAWGNALAIPLAAALTLAGVTIASWLVLAPALKLRDDAHWTERARCFWPARQTAIVLVVVLPILAGALGMLFRSPLAHLGSGGLAVLCAGASLVVALAGQALVDQRVKARPWRAHLRDTGRALFFYTAIYLPHVTLGLLVAALTPEHFGLGTAFMLTVGGVATAALVSGGSAKLGLALGLLRPSDARIDRAVRAALTPGQKRPRAAYRLSLDSANAFALAFSRELLFTDGALEHLDDDQLTAVCAHELAHLSEPRSTLIVRGATLAVLFGFLALAKPLGFTYGPLAILSALLIVAGTLIAMGRVARRMEERADSLGHASETSEGAYASALEAIYRANLAPAVMDHDNQAHPHLYDRLSAAGHAPDYLRPDPPERWRRHVALAAAMVTLVFGMLGAKISALVVSHGDAKPQSTYAALALDDDIAWELGAIGLDRYHDDKLGDAVVFYRAAYALDPVNAYYPLNLALVLARQRRCDDARAALQDGLTRAERAEGDTPTFALQRVIADATTGVTLCARLAQPPNASKTPAPAGSTNTPPPPAPNTDAPPADPATP